MDRRFLSNSNLGAVTVLAAWGVLWFSVLFALAPGVLPV
jgi:hypothetical protein